MNDLCLICEELRSDLANVLSSTIKMAKAEVALIVDRSMGAVSLFCEFWSPFLFTVRAGLHVHRGGSFDMLLSSSASDVHFL